MGIVSGMIYLKRDLSGDENSIPSNGLLNSEMMVGYLFYLIQFWENKCKMRILHLFSQNWKDSAICGILLFRIILW